MFTNPKGLQRGPGKWVGTSPENIQGGSGFNMHTLAKKALTGKVATNLKTRLNRASGIPQARPAYEGEYHPMSMRVMDGEKRFAFNNYLGPNTNVRNRLLRGDRPISKSDRAGMAHDLRFGLAENVDDLRRADEKFKRTLKKLRREGEPAFNTRIGLKGIQLKNALEDVNLMKKTKFLNPFSPEDVKVRKLANQELKRLEQLGYGDTPVKRIGGQTLPPANLLKAILNKKKYMIRPRRRRKHPKPSRKRMKGGRSKPETVVLEKISGFFKKVMVPVVRLFMKKKGKKQMITTKQMDKNLSKQLKGGAFPLSPLNIIKAMIPNLVKGFLPVNLGKMMSGSGFLDKIKYMFGKPFVSIGSKIIKKVLKEAAPNLSRLVGLGLKPVGGALRPVGGLGNMYGKGFFDKLKFFGKNFAKGFKTTFGGLTDIAGPYVSKIAAPIITATVKGLV